MDRKKFIKNIGKGTLAIPFLSSTLIGCSDDEIAGANSANCATSVTNSDDLGPFYISGTTETINLNTQNLSGIPIIVNGIIYGDLNNLVPVSNAIVEIWHADDNGAYHPEGEGNVTGFPADQITLRGYAVTNNEGKYSFQSIRPGLYQGRPRHFHYRITANGYKTLVTQIYFQDDPTTSGESIDSCRIINFSANAQNIIEGQADIRLQAN